MHSLPPTPRPIRLALLVFLFGTLVLQGCDGLTGAEEPESPAGEHASKFRHTHLMNVVTRRMGGGFKQEYSVGLIVAIKPQRVLDRYKILDRYKVLDRYRILDRYEYEHTFAGFAIWADGEEVENLIAEMERDPDILWVEPDIYMGRVLLPLAVETGDGTQLAPWGTQRIGATGYAAGDVDLYVIDTGVSHDDINLVESRDFREDGGDEGDFDGHGTHIAGLAAAIDDHDGLVGVAPGARVHSLKVLGGDEAGGGEEVEMASVIAAVEYVTGRKLSEPNRPMVVNMSLGADIGTPRYNALDEAIAASIANGVTYVISAGNSGIDAANVTPAHVNEAVTVGAYDLFDRFATFSNHGAQVDILAPGTDLISLLSPEVSEDADYVMMSGTSMAAGYVSGAAALFLARNPHASPAQVERAIVQSAAPVINGVPPGTTNRSIDVPALLGTSIPPFFQYALTSGGNVKVNAGRTGTGRLVVSVEPGGDPSRNASVFTNGTFKTEVGDNLIAGFGYHRKNFKLDPSLFQPRYNPTGEPVHKKVPKIAIPSFDAAEFAGRATQTTHGDLSLSGTYTLGTREQPVVWYVDGELKTSGPVHLSGYGVFLVHDGVEIKHTVTTDAGVDETTLGIYSNGGIEFQFGQPVIAAQLFTNEEIEIRSPVTIYGSLTTQESVEVSSQLILYYRPASPALARLFWPAGE